MNENLDLTKILKDCPKGTKLYSRCLGSVGFRTITFDNYIKVIGKNGCYIRFKPNGIYEHSEENAEIDLFPSKDQRDWGKWHRPIVDGEVVYAKVDGVSYIIIYHKQIDERVYRHVCLCLETDMFCCDKDGVFTDDPIDEWRLATEEEKQKLFDVIREKGYKWNAVEKKLEKLIIPKFKVGDKVRNKANGRMTGTIIALYEEVYEVKNSLGNEFSIDFINQDRFELVPNKFDPKTLQPFDKVLTRNLEEQSWAACIYSHMNEHEYYPFTASLINWRYCIPYNNDTKHLVGKIDEAPEFYRYWEE